MNNGRKTYDENNNSIFLNPTGYQKQTFKSYLTKYGKYQVGDFCFKSKTDIKKFNRCLLDSLKIGEKITSKEIVLFVNSLFDNHPDFTSKYKEGYKYISTMLDTEESSKFCNHKRYTIFCFVYANGDKVSFSSNKCIDNIKIKSLF